MTAIDDSSRADIARGKAEMGLAEKWEMQGRMDRQEEREAYAAYEEDEANIQGMLERGMITDEEARRLRTRAKMHRQDQANRNKPQISAKVMAGAGVVATEDLIAQALQTKKKNIWIEMFRRLFRIDSLEILIAYERRRRMHPDYKPMFPFICAMIHHGMSFELVMFSLVAMNSVLTGVLISVKGTDNESDYFQVLEEGFTIAFIVEIVLRVMADGWLWFFDWGNFLDFSLIVGTGVIPTFLGAFLGIGDNPVIRCGQALRCIRLVRILKKVRAKFQTLWSLVNGIAQSGRILLWTLVIMIVILYMFALFGVQLMQKSDLQFTPEQLEVVDIHFAEMLGGMFTLFQIVTLDSWTGISRPLHSSYWLIGAYFIAFVCVACMVLENLIVAVICNNAFKSVEEDAELQAALTQATVEAELAAFCEVFDLMDPDGSELLSKEDFENGLESVPQIFYKLKVAGLADDEIQNLWEFMAFPPEINSSFFASQLRTLKGDCKAKDSYKVTMTLHKLIQRIEKVTHKLEQHRRYAEVLQRDLLVLQQEFGNLMHEVKAFVVTSMRCIPPDPVPMTKKKIDAVSKEMTKKVLPNTRPMLRREYTRRPLEQKKLEAVFALPGQIEDIPAPPGVPSRMSILDKAAAEAAVRSTQARNEAIQDAPKGANKQNSGPATRPLSRKSMIV